MFNSIRNFQKECEEIHKDVAKILNYLLNSVNYEINSPKASLIAFHEIVLGDTNRYWG